MTQTKYPNKILFGNKDEQGTHVALEDDNIDFGVKMTNAIDVQMIDTNLYMSKELWLPYGSRGAFGGQIVAQALNAGFQTIPEEFFIHSLHAYFILACNVEIPVIYKVRRVRDGRSYVTRIITATQRGKAIFVCSCSFAKPDNSVHLDHQSNMPDVIDPDSLPSDIESLQSTLESSDYPQKFRKRLEKRMADDQPVDYREVASYTPEEIATGNVKPNAYNQRWFKTRGKLGDDLRLHACIIAYASDSGFVNTAAKANGLTFNSEGVGMMTSLDHTIWFHQSARADEWLLYDMHSPRTSGGRGVAFGRIYTRDGLLVATTAQEGIVRLSEREQEHRRKQALSEQEIKFNQGENSRL